MSRYPDNNLVDEMRVALDQLTESDRTIRELEAQVKLLPKAKDDAARAMRTVMDLLEKMDCRSTGNFGWENRFVTLLMRLNAAPVLTPEEADLVIGAIPLQALPQGKDK